MERLFLTALWYLFARQVKIRLCPLQGQNRTSFSRERVDSCIRSVHSSRMQRFTLGKWRRMKVVQLQYWMIHFVIVRRASTTTLRTTNSCSLIYLRLFQKRCYFRSCSPTLDSVTWVLFLDVASHLLTSIL